MTSVHGGVPRKVCVEDKMSEIYHSLLELHYWDWMHKSQTTREWATKVGLSFREAEQRLDAKLFLDKYPRWEIEAPHQSIILHEMFLHATE